MLLAQQQLYELALFRRVELLPMPGQERHTDRGLVVLLEEGLHKSYVVGLGWNETDRFRVTLGWYHLNLFGGAHAFSVETVLSGTEERFQLGRPRAPSAQAQPPGLLRDLPDLRGVRDLRAAPPGSVDRCRRPLQTTLPIVVALRVPDRPARERERRNRTRGGRGPHLIHHPDPRMGLSRQSTGADPGDLQRDRASTMPSRSSRPTPSSSSSSPEPPSTAPSPTVAAPSASGSAPSTPWAPTATLPANLQVPLNTRFFAGGSNTHRAFRRDYLGIPGQTINSEGDPVGGNALVLFNAEYIRKVWWLFSTHVFVDAGNVWDSPRSDVRFGDIRWGAGLGFSLDTPAGPIRLEYGWKLDREPGESPGQLWLSFGIPF